MSPTPYGDDNFIFITVGLLASIFVLIFTSILQILVMRIQDNIVYYIINYENAMILCEYLFNLKHYITSL